MKKGLKKVQIILLALAILICSINLNYIYAKDEIATGTCGDNIEWSLDGNGILTITGIGNMGGSSCAWVDYKDKVKKAIIDEGITIISDCAFEYNENLETVILPSTLTNIKRRAFANCTSLKNIEFPNNLTIIGPAAFYMCTSLETVDLSEEVKYINDAAFAECSSLKSVTVRAFYNVIGDSIYTFNETAQIYGYTYSNAFYYARKYGRTFTDLNTNESTTETVTNQDYLDVLPTSNLKAIGITSHGGRNYSSSNIFEGYKTVFCNEMDYENETFQSIKSKVNEITVDCQTDREKAYAIMLWVFNNMNYKYGWGCRANITEIYSVYSGMKGNCEASTMLTNYMLYLCGIPTATVSNVTHEWSAAFVDGEWIYVDATHKIFGISNTNNTVNQISFAYDGLVYVIDEPSKGWSVAGIAKNDKDIEKLTTFKIPTNSYMKNIYSTAFDDNIELKAEIGTIGETFIRNNRKYLSINKNIITGRNTNILKGDVNEDGKITLADYTKILAHVKQTKFLTGDSLLAADVNGDGKVTLADCTKILVYVKNI